MLQYSDGKDKTRTLDALNAALNVAEWHMEQLKYGKKEWFRQ